MHEHTPAEHAPVHALDPAKIGDALIGALMASVQMGHDHPRASGMYFRVGPDSPPEARFVVDMLLATTPQLADKWLGGLDNAAAIAADNNILRRDPELAAAVEAALGRMHLSAGTEPAREGTPLIHLVQPTEFAALTRETLGETYETVCAATDLPATEAGYGVMMGVRPDGSRVTMLAADISIVRELAAMPPEARVGVAVPPAAFPAGHDGWLDLPPSAILARHGRIARFGPAEYALGPDRPIHKITYSDDGEMVGHGYANGAEIDTWRDDLTADGWVVDDRAVEAGAST